MRARGGEGSGIDGTMGSACQRPDGLEREPVSTWTSLHVILTWVASKVARQPWSHSWPIEMSELASSQLRKEMTVANSHHGKGRDIEDGRVG